MDLHPTRSRRGCTNDSLFCERRGSSRDGHHPRRHWKHHRMSSPPRLAHGRPVLSLEAYDFFPETLFFQGRGGSTDPGGGRTRTHVSWRVDPPITFGRTDVWYRRRTCGRQVSLRREPTHSTRGGSLLFRRLLSGRCRDAKRRGGHPQGPTRTFNALVDPYYHNEPDPLGLWTPLSVLLYPHPVESGVSRLRRCQSRRPPNLPIGDPLSTLLPLTRPTRDLTLRRV